MATAGKAEDKWTEHKDENGRTYYYNFARKQGVWEKPEGFQEEEQSTAGMEVEDSSDPEDFRPVVKAKRKKPAEVNVRNGQALKKLLNSNKFSPLAEENENNNNANPAAEKTTPVVPASGTSAGQKKQPPLVVKNASFSQLAKVMVTCDVQPEQKLTRSGIKLTCFSSEDFEKVQTHLKEKKVQFYTHGRRCERPHRVVIRGLPNLEPEFIKKLLKKDHQLEALAVYTIKRKQQLPAVNETPVIVLFPKGHANLKELNSKVTKVGPVVIRWEAYRNKEPHVTQCKNCLQFGHGAINCHLKPRCSSCGGPHSTDKCQAQEAQATKCANCSGSHEGLDRSCPKREQFLQSRQQASKPKPPAWKKTKRIPTEPKFNAEEFPPLPDPVPVVEPKRKNPRPPGSGGNKEPQIDGATKVEEEKALFNPAECWSIFTEFLTRLRGCRSRSEQLAVLGYMACKYGP